LELSRVSIPERRLIAMTQNDRLEVVKDVLRKQRYVSVEQLSQSLNVSSMSIRRDLKQLCDLGFAERCHGGARLPQNTVAEVDYDEKKVSFIEQKQRIAAKAVSLLKPDDTVYLDSGTTTGEIAKLLCSSSIRLSVVTNDLHVAILLSSSSVDLTILGGTVHKRTKSVLGHGAERLLSEFRFTKSFVGAPSINYNFDVFSPTYDKIPLKRMLFDLSSQIYLVADEHKFYAQSLCLIESASRFTGIITTKVFDEEEERKLEELGISVIQA
jgi:DeoR/GlpR family transcriptional regulator of sugar metabolism